MSTAAPRKPSSHLTSGNTAQRATTPGFTALGPPGDAQIRSFGGLLPDDSFSFRVFSSADEKGVLSAYKKLCDTELPNMRTGAHMHNLIYRHGGKHATLLLLCDGLVLGGATFKLFHNEQDNAVVLDVLAQVVAQQPGVCGKGHGTRIVNALKRLLLDRATELGASAILLAQADDGPKALAFWARQGLQAGPQANALHTSLLKASQEEASKKKGSGRSVVYHVYTSSVPMLLQVSARDWLCDARPSERAQAGAIPDSAPFVAASPARADATPTPPAAAPPLSLFISIQAAAVTPSAPPAPPPLNLFVSASSASSGCTPTTAKPSLPALMPMVPPAPPPFHLTLSVSSDASVCTPSTATIAKPVLPMAFQLAALTPSATPAQPPLDFFASASSAASTCTVDTNEHAVESPLDTSVVLGNSDTTGTTASTTVVSESTPLPERGPPSKWIVDLSASTESEIMYEHRDHPGLRMPLPRALTAIRRNDRLSYALRKHTQTSERKAARCRAQADALRAKREAQRIGIAGAPATPQPSAGNSMLPPSMVPQRSIPEALAAPVT